MAVYEALLLNTVVPQIQAAQAGDSYVMVVNATTPALRITQTGTGNALEVEDSANPDATPFVVSAAGDVGIGTSSPAYKFHVYGSGASGIGVFQHSAGAAMYIEGGATNGVLGTVGNNAISFAPNSTNRMLLDTSGNLGLGVTPSAWGNNFKAIQISPRASIFSNTSLNDTVIANNYYNNNNNNVYYQTGYANAYVQVSGEHRFYAASSGAANTTTITNGVSYTIITSGNQTAFGAANNNVGTAFTATSSGTLSSGTVSQNISFTQAMTLDASGNFLVGPTSGSDPESLGSPYINVKGAVYALKSSDTSKYVAIGAAGTAGYVIAQSGLDSLRLYAGGSERARITSGGNLNFGNSSADRATTAGTAVINIFNGTAPVGTLANGISLYSSSGEAYVMDAAGNATLFSPHDSETNEWIFKSKHTPSGKVLKIDVEKMLRFINDHFGLDAIHEFTEE
jgi:hypothetical protein